MSGWIFRIVGVYFLANKLFGRSLSEVAGNIDWKFLPIKRSDFNLIIRDGKLLGVLSIRIEVINNNPVSIYLDGFTGTIRQAGQPLGLINTTNTIELPSNQVKAISLKLDVNSQNLLDRIKTVIENGGILAPIEIDGEVRIKGGKVLPINQKVNFFSIG